MKALLKISLTLLLTTGLLVCYQPVVAQDDEAEATGQANAKPVKSTFESTWLIDNQSVMVPAKGTLQMDIMHRFGTVNNGYDDFWGIYAPSNIRIGMS
ncbi:MAG: DUF5777 family beta-barrel protein, partial [Cyclobacteriaceae bacterium]